jgi:flagellar biosynthesis protein FlhG
MTVPRRENPLLTRASQPLTLAITSGKGGVGKTTVVANLALALARGGLRVTVLDADLGLANLDVLLGLTPKKTIEHFFREEIPMEEIVLEGPLGIRLVPAGSGLPELTDLSQAELLRFVDGLRSLRRECDVLLIDTSAGIGDQVSRMLFLADRTILVTWPEPTALVDAYAALKVALRHRADARIGLVVNGTKGAEEARRIHERLETASRKFLGRSIELEGHVVLDDAVVQSSRRQQPVVLTSPMAPSSQCFDQLASRIAARVEGGLRGAIEEPCAGRPRVREVMH